MTLLRDLISIPEHVYKGDFVLRLTEGVAQADATIDSYVVTPELVRNFDDALNFIRSALDGRSSKATYLDGSFGSGKSHFMAVLHLLLQGNTRARAIPELAPVVAKHDAWLRGKRFLLVPYHMIDSKSLESAVLGHYVEHVRALHPDAPIPGVYLAESLFADAETLRRRMGDDSFFAELNARDSGGGPWGNIERRWDAARFDAAIAELPVWEQRKSEERVRLVGDLVETFFKSYATAMRGQDEAYVPLEQGLSTISRHARDLGYDGLILFLDELILWLASRAADTGFVNREIQKVPKLVESQVADRPVPIVSFIARQRDLRQLIGEHVPGSERLAFADILKYWEGRLHTIGLLDRNLPAIAQKRVLQPRSEAARAQLDSAFADLMRSRREVIETLLTTQADRDMFRQVYPFSPALVTTLVAVSSLLQRERTAIKVMLQLLVDQRDTLALGDLVPVGDLFDVIAEGDEAFSDDMRLHFDNTKRLYHQKLLPLLEAEHRMRVEEARRLPASDPRAAAFTADDRLVKTLLLSALASEVEPLRNLTGTRLANLNHGTIRSPVAGREGQMVVTKLRRWATAVGEIKIGDEADPTIALEVSSVDTETILERANVVDSPGERLRKVREMLLKGLGIEYRDELFLVHDFLWRNTRRECDVIFTNIRSLPLESLRAREDRWKLIIDFPFDEESYSPADDLLRLQEFRDQEEASSRTLCWIPAYLTAKSLTDLGTLVKLDHILTGDRLNEYASHLSAADRLVARSLLDNRRGVLRDHLQSVLEGAYGVSQPPPDTVDDTLELSDRVQSLDRTFRPRPPVGQHLGAALQNLLAQALDHQYPAHPHFETEIKLSVLKRVHDALQNESDEQHRLLIDKALRPLVRQVALPLKLGEMGDTHFVPGDSWKNHFLRKKAQDGGALTVEKMRRWTDEPDPRGLQTWVQNFLIIQFAERESYRFLLHGGPAGAVTLDSLHDDLQLEPINLPPAAEWKAAGERAGPIFGVTAPGLCSANNAAKLADDIRAEAQKLRADCQQLSQKLRARLQGRGLDAKGSARMQTASAVLALVEGVVAAAPEQVVSVLANATVATSPTAMGGSFRKAAALASALDDINWEIFESIEKLQDGRAARAADIRRRVDEALAADEYALPLQSALRQAQSDALRLLTETETPPAPPPPATAAPPIASQGREAGVELERARAIFRGLERQLGERPGRTLSLEWKIGERGKKA